MISLATIATMFGCLEGGLAFDKDWEKDIYQKVVDLMLYGKLRQKKQQEGDDQLPKDRKPDLCVQTYPHLSVQHGHAQTRVIDYVSDRDRFYMYKLMVGEKVNLLKVILY